MEDWFSALFYAAEKCRNIFTDVLIAIFIICILSLIARSMFYGIKK